MGSGKQLVVMIPIPIPIASKKLEVSEFGVARGASVVCIWCLYLLFVSAFFLSFRDAVCIRCLYLLFVSVEQPAGRGEEADCTLKSNNPTLKGGEQKKLTSMGPPGHDVFLFSFC